MNRRLALCLALLMCLPAQAEELVAGPGLAVRLGLSVWSDGQLVESSQEGEPVSLLLGRGLAMPGLETALAGMKAGEEKTFTVPAREAYGPILDGAVRAVPASALPPGLQPVPGMALELRSGPGLPRTAMVRSVADGKVTLDFNHPLAGRDLDLRIRVLEVARPPMDAVEAALPGQDFPDLIKVNDLGVVYLANLTDRHPTDRVAALFSQLARQADHALEQCALQVIEVETGRDLEPSHGLLNRGTRKALEALVDPATGKVAEARVVSGLLARHAGPQDRRRRHLDCEVQLAPLAGEDRALARLLRGRACPRVTRLTTCLEDLRTADQRVARQAGPAEPLRYSGAPWDSDLNYLGQFEPGRRIE